VSRRARPAGPAGRGSDAPLMVLAAAVLTFVASAPGLAQTGRPAIDVEVSARTIAENETVRVTLRISGEGADGARVDNLPPEGDKLLPLGGWSTSTQMSWINGRFSASKELSTEYVPSGLGAGRVPSFTVRLGGEVVKTEPVSVKIVAAEDGGTARPGGGGPAAGGRGSSGDAGNEVEVVPRVSRRRLFIGETFTLEYVLRTRVSVSGVSPESLQPFPGFIVADLDVHPRSTEKEVRDDSGRTWREYVLFRRRLTPTRAGPIEIPSVPFQVEVPTRRDDLLRFAFRSGARRVARVARGVTIDVQPLPEGGRPDAFSGAVGRFSLDARLAAGTAVAGQAVELEVSVEGSGPLDAVSPPEVLAPGDLQVFSPREKEPGSGVKTWTYPLVPRAAGEVRIEGVRFGYFDTGEEAYRELTAGPFTLEVQPAPPSAAAGAAGGTGGPVRAQATDLHFIHAAPRRLASREGVPGGALLAALAGAPVVLLPLAVALGRLRSRFVLSAAGRRRRAEARVRAEFRDAEKLAGRDADAALRSVLAGLHAWLDGVVGEPSRPLERSRLKRLIAEKSGDGALADRAVAVLDRAEAARYAGAASGVDVRGIIADARVLAEAS